MTGDVAFLVFFHRRVFIKLVKKYKNFPDSGDSNNNADTDEDENLTVISVR
ncbi:hypothetical protein MNBD_NITROSPINAE01-486 [hydrothermal vent metagenome]|uniref:Uncharacterized protein n=1 Tax=hydrothermal vent metagenome TaxID=652676 RepID=A0A3B1C6Z4_9ZZZZ